MNQTKYFGGFKMSENRKAISEEKLEQVAGGFFSFHRSTGCLDYTHPDGSTTTHKIVNFDKAWELSNKGHAHMVPEDDILAEMISKGYIE